MDMDKTDALNLVLPLLERLAREMTVGQRYTTEGQELLDALSATQTALVSPPTQGSQGRAVSEAGDVFERIAAMKEKKSAQNGWCLCKDKCLSRGTMASCKGLPSPLVEKPVGPKNWVPQIKTTLAVAIAGLFEHYPEDVIKAFSIQELEEIINITAHLKNEQVQDIYKKSWSLLNTVEVC